MPEHWTDTPIHVIDFEGSKASGILEYGVVTLHKGDVSAVHTRICAPSSSHIPAAETQVHGLGKEETSGKAPFTSEQELFMSLRESGPLCAHNAAFENHLLKSLWPYPRKSPDFASMATPKGIATWGPWIDTLRLYELVFPMLADHSLGALLKTFNLCEQLDIIASDYCPSGRCHYHCALYDAIGSALLLTHMGRLPGYEDLELSWLIDQSQPATEEPGQLDMFE